MTDTIRLVLPGTPSYDPATGITTDPTPLLLYAGIARVKPFQSVSESAQTGQRLVVQRRYEVALPWATAPADRVVPGAQVIVDASDDARLVGRTLWVTSIEDSATSTAWRIATEDRT